MRFNYTGDDAGLQAAVEFANNLLERDEFWELVKSSGPYDYASVPATEICDYMRGYNGVCHVREFWPRRLLGWKFRKTVAYVDAKHEGVIFMNGRFFSNSIAQKTNTLVHEFVHMTDYFGDDSELIEYGHGSQSSSGKRNSAPYAIGQIAEEFYKSEHPSFIKSFTREPLHFDCDLGEIPPEFLT